MPSVEAEIRAGAAVLAFDTNAIIGRSRRERRTTVGAFLTICDDANRLRDHVGAPLTIGIVVPALVRWEALHDLRVGSTGRPFDPARVKNDLRNKAVVREFDEEAAVGASGVLHRWFPTDEAWQDGKRARLTAQLGVAPHAAPATIDWAIATQAEAESWILVTDDTGPELAGVSRKIKKGALRALLNALLRERGL